MRFAFIDAQKANYPVLVLCRVLRVGRSGFYKWLHRVPWAHTGQDAVLNAHIAKAFLESHNTYGSPRVHAQLQAKGQRTSKRRVERLMRSLGLCAARKRRRVRTTDSNHALPVAPNVLQRNFTARAPNQVWTTDITYLWTLDGWLYLAAVLDLFSRRVVGWAMSQHINEPLVLCALDMALKTRRPLPGLIHHSDMGVQYCAAQYRTVLKAHGIVRSMSRKGDCWDSAVSDSFFGTLKQELIFRCELMSQAEARSAVFEYLEVF